MTKRHFTIFTEVCRQMSFSKAAEALNTTQPTVSLAVKELEEHYGVRLFERMNRRIYMTEAGRALLSTAQEVLRGFQQAEDQLRKAPYRLRVGANVTFGATRLPRVLAQFRRKCPQVELSALVGNSDGIERLLLDGIVIYLVDNEFYFGDRIYLGGEAEGEQYAFFARAILEALPRLDFTPEILHCNDWHTAVLPMLMKTQYAGRMQSRMQTLLTIHNIAYQGKFSFEFVQDLLGIDARYYTPEFMELNGCANLLKAGCVFADHINTVSPSYAGEIRTAAYGEGLEGILNARQHQLSGILNGIDTAVFDPAHDGGIAAPYSADDLSGKAACRAALCRELGLEIGAHTPIVAMVTRMTPQKGFDLVQCVLDELMDSEDMAFVLLGTGNAEYEDFMRGAEWRHKGRLCAYIGYILHAVLV